MLNVPKQTDTEATRLLRGVAASPGISHAPAVIFTRPDLSFEPHTVNDTKREKQRLENAVSQAIEELQAVKDRVLASLGEESAHIFRSQQTILEDDSILGEINDVIVAESCLAETAVNTVFSVYSKMFEELGEEDYNRERVADLNDVQKRVLMILLGRSETSLSELTRECIIVAEELFPSDTATMKADLVSGIVTERGGITSHAAILAGNLGIPAAVGVSEATERIAAGNDIYLDVTEHDTAKVHIDPGDSVRNEFARRAERYREEQARLARQKSLKPVTIDGQRMILSANIGSVDEIQPAISQGAKSVGLFRSEFLFMRSKTIPDEETQYAAYKAALEAFSDDGFVILRTLDIGADKPIDSISIPAEDNPFLGYRGVRISLARTDLFRTQLRAAFRASAFGALKIMFPMISGPDEVGTILDLIEEVKKQLSREGHRFDPEVEIGIMIEVPSAIWMVDKLIEMVDFFSIGTNDLTQYLLAADRMNDNIRDYYQPYHPAVFRAIRAVVETAHTHGKWVGVCGELGGMPPAIPILVGLGVDELSMGARGLPEAIHTVRHMRSATARVLAEEVLSSADAVKIKEAAQRYIYGDEE